MMDWDRCLGLWALFFPWAEPGSVLPGLESQWERMQEADLSPVA